MGRKRASVRLAVWGGAVLLCICAFGKPAYGQVTGQRPLLVIMVEYLDSTFADPQFRSAYEARIFGPGDPSAASYFAATSHGAFTYAAAAAGETEGGADGMVRVTMNVRVGQIPEGDDYRRDALALADPYVNFGGYDTDRNGVLENDELAVLVIQANGGDTGKVREASGAVLDKVSVARLPVAVISELAPDYILCHELAHLVDYSGYTKHDLYNLRDGLLADVQKWDVAPAGDVSFIASRGGEIALDLDAGPLGTSSFGVTAYRDQNGQLSLAAYDLVSRQHPVSGPIARAGLAEDLSVAQLSAGRVVTACRLQNGRFKLIVWDMGLDLSWSRQGEYTGGHASDLAVTGAGESRVVLALRTESGYLKFAAFEVSRSGDLARVSSFLPGDEARDINLINLSANRLVAAYTTTGGNLKIRCVDLSGSGEFAARSGLTFGPATELGLTPVSLRRAAVSFRRESGAVEVRLFNVSRSGELTGLGSWVGGPVCDSSIQCTGKSDPILSDMTPRTSIIGGLAFRRLVVAWIDPDKLLQIRTLDYSEDGQAIGEAGSYTCNGTYLAAKLVRIGSDSFASFARVDGQVWTGNHFGLLGDNTSDRLVHFDPYTKLKLGWLPHTTISGPPGSTASYSLLPMGGPSAEAAVIRVPGHRDSEYFILEVRSRDTVYDRAVRDEGLAIWHIDEEKAYPHPFTSLEWLGGSADTALWSADEVGLLRYSGRSDPAGSRWSDFSLSGITIRVIGGFEPGGISFLVRF